MVKIYHARGQGQNGERLVATDAKDLRAFEEEFAEALVELFSYEAGIDPTEADTGNDLSYALSFVIPSAFQLAFKLAGYKASGVREQRLLISGSATPNESDAVVTVGIREMVHEMATALKDANGTTDHG